MFLRTAKHTPFMNLTGLCPKLTMRELPEKQKPLRNMAQEALGMKAMCRTSFRVSKATIKSNSRSIFLMELL